jgi:gluconokinase
MGVSGVGKSTVGKMLSERLGLEFAEGDDFHPRTNIEKMSAGIPLDDDDRRTWLEALAAWTRRRHEAGVSTVITCSALRRRYRDLLRTGGVETYFVHLVGTPEVVEGRMSGRRHFMPASLLRSQLDTLEQLEPDETGASFDVLDPPEVIVDEVVDALDLG